MLTQLLHSQEVGTVVYGQKTLQRQASALDRVNVRRLLIALLKDTLVKLLKHLLYSNKTQQLQETTS
jgi:hypothetical protein